MKFELIDKIIELESGKRIVAVKAVSLAEEYLADHFPTFPVLPGVLMLQAMVEAGAWLMREATDFSPNPILLSEAKNVTYKSFVKPGSLLTLEITCRSLAPEGGEFDGVGASTQVEVVRAKFKLKRLELGDDQRMAAACNPKRTSHLRARLALLRGISSTETRPL